MTLRRKVMGGLLAVALIGGAAGCSTPAPTTGPYPLIPTAERAVAISFFGIDGQGDPSSVRSGTGRVQLVVFDAVPLMTQSQLAVLRSTYEALRRPDVRLLHISVDPSLLLSHSVVRAGRSLTAPAVVDLVAQVYQLAGAGFSYTQLIDRRGRVAADLIGTSDPARLAETVQQLLRRGA